MQMRCGTASERAKEAKLLAEEKWIIDAIKELRQQKLNLALERMYLERRKAKLVARKKSKEARERGEAPSDEPVAATSSQPDVPVADIGEECCFAGVDLTPTKSVFFPLEIEEAEKDKSSERKKPKQ